MTPLKLSILDETGFAVLRPCELAIPAHEWLDLRYVEWKSSGDTEFAPLASATGDLDCGGFWVHGKPDTGGVWTANAPLAPTLVRWVEQVGAPFGRCRVIKLQPQTYEETLRQLHLDDNNRINPDDQGWIVRTFLQLTDNPESFMVLRTDRDDPATERRIPLRAGTQLVVDSERLYHAVCHRGSGPRYALITSFESGPALQRWIDSHSP